jgi:hypothetical protein
MTVAGAAAACGAGVTMTWSSAQAASARGAKKTNQLQRIFVSPMLVVYRC